MKRIIMVMIIVILAGLISTAAPAGVFDGSQPVICAVIETNECDKGEDCYRGVARNINLPQFLRIDFDKKMISGTLESGLVKKTDIKRMNHVAGKLILQGVEGGMGWSIAITEKTGKLVLSAAGEAVGFIVFGACIPSEYTPGTEAAASDESDTEQFELLWTDLAKAKKIAFSEAIMLTDKEGAGFWPIYEAFQKELKDIGLNFYNLLLAYAKKSGSLSDEDSMTLINEFIDIDSERIRLEKAYMKKFSNVLPPKKLMEFYRLEIEIKAAIEHEITKSIPALQ